MSTSGEPEERDDGFVDPQNHFCWDLESSTEWKDITECLERKRSHFNFLKPHKALKRYRIGLMMSYIMFTHDLEGWSNCLDNAILEIEYSRHPTVKKPLMNLPPLDSPLWKGPFEQFVSYLPEAQVGPEHDLNRTGIDAEVIRKQEPKWNSFEGIYVPAEHIALSLKASMLTKRAPNDSVDDLWRKIVPIREMTDAEKAGIYYIKAATLRLFGTQGLIHAVDPMKKAVLLDPDKLLWALKLIMYKGLVRQVNGWGMASWSDVEDIIKVADSVLELELEDWMREEFQYEKFLAIQSFLRDPSNRDKLSAAEKYELTNESTELVNALVGTTTKPRILAHCAMYYARHNTKSGIDRAVEIIENILKNDSSEKSVLSKAIVIYKKAGQLHNALRWAEIGAESSIGSYMQILTIKTELKHTFDPDEFFLTGLNKYKQSTEARTIHMNAFTYYTTLTNHFKRAIGHFKKVLDSEPPEQYFRLYNVWTNSMVHTGEAAHNVILYVLSDDKTYFDEEYIEDNDFEMFMQVRQDIEESFDVESFEKHGNTPKEYLEWFKTARNPRVPKFNSHYQKTEPQEWMRRKPNATTENFEKQRMDWSRNRTGSSVNYGNRPANQTTCYVAARSRQSTSQDWRSRPSTSNTANANPRNSNAFTSSRFHDRDSGSYQSQTRHTYGFQSNWRAQDGESGPKPSHQSHTRYTQDNQSNCNWRARGNASQN